MNNSHEVTYEKNDNEILAKMVMCLCMIDRSTPDLGKTHSVDLFMGLAVSVSSLLDCNVWEARVWTHSDPRVYCLSAQFTHCTPTDLKKICAFFKNVNKCQTLDFFILPKNKIESC